MIKTCEVRQGRLANLSVLRATAHHAALGDLQVIEDLLDVVSRSRLDPRLSTRLAIPIWLYEQTTVRASKQPTPLDVPLPAKKIATLTRARAARA